MKFEVAEKKYNECASLYQKYIEEQVKDAGGISRLAKKVGLHISTIYKSIERQSVSGLRHLALQIKEKNDEHNGIGDTKI